MLDQKKIKTLLEKINWLTDSFQENDFKNVSALEKSLLKEKVLMFYDEIQNISTAITKERIQEKTEEVKPVVEKVEVVQGKIIEPEPKIVDVFEELESPVVETKPIETKIETKPQVELSKQEKFQKTEAFQKQVAMPKRDMREIIDLNKSFILKAELFSQNNDSYNQFLNELNQTRSEDDAQKVLVQWTSKLNWETEENKAYDLVVRAIEKRFLPLI